ncbi:glycosyltransferase [Pseudorhizobium endolithicum]|uniref:Glycosyltransferase n=1 Tax=Pseudorhizobium endolithicum TaxID=1191678 RepID=A0ABN7K282_9HYPH|nr:hypothetical protein [Pseudorhizobium endolithicum]CAD7054794.1 glycosyltransferase [Pseudorhizobium endolithicum]
MRMSSGRQGYQADTAISIPIRPQAGERERFSGLGPGARDASGSGSTDRDPAPTYALVEAMALRGGAPASISFLDARSALRGLIDKTYREWLRSHLLLPSWGVPGRLAARLRLGRTCADYAPETFIPALLTFVEHPLRVLVLGRAEQEADALCHRLHRHAPWHCFLSASIDRLPGPSPFDLVLIVVPDVGLQDRLRLATIPANLRIFCGRSLRLSVVPGSGGGIAGTADRSRRTDRKAA